MVIARPDGGQARLKLSLAAHVAHPAKAKALHGVDDDSPGEIPPRVLIRLAPSEGVAASWVQNTALRRL